MYILAVFKDLAFKLFFFLVTELGDQPAPWQEEGFLTPRFTFNQLKQHMTFDNITYVREVKQCVRVIAMARTSKACEGGGAKGYLPEKLMSDSVLKWLVQRRCCHRTC